MTGAGSITTARVYGLDPASLPAGAARLLVDRVWPRGIRKADLDLDEWVRDVAPSTALRKWFGHKIDRWPEFETRYRAELSANTGPVDDCLAWCRKGPVVLLYGAHDTQHNQAVVLARFLAEKLTATGSPAAGRGKSLSP